VSFSDKNNLNMLMVEKGEKKGLSTTAPAKLLKTNANPPTTSKLSHLLNNPNSASYISSTTTRNKNGSLGRASYRQAILGVSSSRNSNHQSNTSLATTVSSNNSKFSTISKKKSGSQQKHKPDKCSSSKDALAEAQYPPLSSSPNVSPTTSSSSIRSTATSLCPDLGGDMNSDAKLDSAPDVVNISSPSSPITSPSVLKEKVIISSSLPPPSQSKEEDHTTDKTSLSQPNNSETKGTPKKTVTKPEKRKKESKTDTTLLQSPPSASEQQEKSALRPPPGFSTKLATATNSAIKVSPSSLKEMGIGGSPLLGASAQSKTRLPPFLPDLTQSNKNIVGGRPLLAIDASSPPSTAFFEKSSSTNNTVQPISLGDSASSDFTVNIPSLDSTNNNPLLGDLSASSILLTNSPQEQDNVINRPSRGAVGSERKKAGHDYLLNDNIPNNELQFFGNDSLNSSVCNNLYDGFNIEHFLGGVLDEPTNNNSNTDDRIAAVLVESVENPNTSSSLPSWVEDIANNTGNSNNLHQSRAIAYGIDVMASNVSSNPQQNLLTPAVLAIESTPISEDDDYFSGDTFLDNLVS